MKGGLLAVIPPPEGCRLTPLVIEARAFGAPVHWQAITRQTNEQGGFRHGAPVSGVRTLGIGAKVRLFGTVDHDTLAFLYSACTVFVFPSLYEGFGLPPLEAMACGAPVVSSTSSSIPEVLGPAAAYFSPESVDSLMTALCRVLDSSEYRSRLSRMGLARAQLFTWEEAARRTMDVYRKVLGVSR